MGMGMVDNRGEACWWSEITVLSRTACQPLRINCILYAGDQTGIREGGERDPILLPSLIG